MISQRKESPGKRAYFAPYDVGTKFMVVDLGGIFILYIDT